MAWRLCGNKTAENCLYLLWISVQIKLSMKVKVMICKSKIGGRLESRYEKVSDLPRAVIGGKQNLPWHNE